ncbi:MAG: hypothetical protein M0C28_11510 [Candidatus Moduliflexus flocculans]|nr:hypothetical protein [Candidatus Moduliflexus flocculans]
MPIDGRPRRGAAGASRGRHYRRFSPFERVHARRPDVRLHRLRAERPAAAVSLHRLGAGPLADLMGGFEGAALVHRVCARVLMGVVFVDPHPAVPVARAGQRQRC